jgi:hypothetical protein
LAGGVNAYSYVENHPSTTTDPQGLIALQGAGFLAGAILGATSAGGGAMAAGGSATQVAVAATLGALVGGAGAALNPGALFTGGVNATASVAGQMIAGKGLPDVNLSLVATSALSATGVMGVGNLVREVMTGSWKLLGVGVVAVGQASVPTRAAAALLGKYLPLTLRDLGEWFGAPERGCTASDSPGVLPAPFAP